MPGLSFIQLGSMEGFIMYAAVVNSFDHPPQYQYYETPVPGKHQVLVDVLAAGLHQLVRSTAQGSHYSSPTQLPFIPGVDGVGRLADGKLVYFLTNGALGTFAEKTVIDPRGSIPVPETADPVKIAGGMNPAMASWLALNCRIHFQFGQKVLILGATGNSGKMAVQIAKHLGASDIICAGRDTRRLESLRELGATHIVSLAGDMEGAAQKLSEVASDVDVVLDYLWGAPAEHTISSLVTKRTDSTKALDWISIGAMAGGMATIPSSVLRSANFRLLGSGIGSIPVADVMKQLPSLVTLIAEQKLQVDVISVPLSQIEEAWNASSNGKRLVIVPDTH